MTINEPNKSEHLFLIQGREQQQLLRIHLEPAQEKLVEEKRLDLTALVNRLPPDITQRGSITLHSADIEHNRAGIEGENGTIRLVRLVRPDSSSRARELKIGGLTAPLHTPKKSWGQFWNAIPKFFRYFPLFAPVSAAVSSWRWYHQPNPTTKSAKTLNTLLEKQRPKNMGDFRDLLQMEAKILRSGKPSTERESAIQQALDRAAVVSGHERLGPLVDEWLPTEAGVPSIITSKITTYGIRKTLTRRGSDLRHSWFHSDSRSIR